MRARVAAFEWILIAGSLLVLTAWMPHDIVGDDSERMNDIQQLLFHGHLTDSRFSLIQGLLASPLIALGKVVKSPDWFGARFNLVVVTVALAIAFLATRRRIDPALFRRLALVLLVDSYLTNRLRYYGAETVTTALVVLGLLAVVSRRYVLLGWAAIVVGVANVPASVAGLALAAAGWALVTRRLRPLLAVPAALLLIGIEDWVRRGSPFTTGYAGDHGVLSALPYSGRPGFSFPFLLGVAAILFSFGRGLLFFFPGLVLWLGRGTRRVTPAHAFVTLQLLFVTGLVLVYAKWWAWFGGISWGPRFFLFAAVPASLFLAGQLWNRDAGTAETALALAVFALSAWVGLAGMLEDGTLNAHCLAASHLVQPFCWYAPEISPLWWPVVHHPALTGPRVVLIAWWAIVSVYLAAPAVVRLLHGAHRQAVQLAHGWRL